MVKNKQPKVYLASPKLRVLGEVDEVLTLTDGTMAPLDYKYTEFTFQTHRIQSTIHTMLITEIYNKPVNKGYICYLREGMKLKATEYQQTDFNKDAKVIYEIINIIQLGFFLQKTPCRNKCIDCCYRIICI